MVAGYCKCGGRRVRRLEERAGYASDDADDEGMKGREVVGLACLVLCIVEEGKEGY